MTVYNISSIVNLSLHLTASPGNIKAGFQEIYTFNRDIFHDEEFMGAYVTDRSTPPVVAPASNSNSEPPKTSIDSPGSSITTSKEKNTPFFPRGHLTSS
jgi:hypothetical protein